MFNKFNRNRNQETTRQSGETLPLYPSALPVASGKEQNIEIGNKNPDFSYLEIVSRHNRISQNIDRKIRYNSKFAK